MGRLFLCPKVGKMGSNGRGRRRARGGILAKTSKRRGELAELAFALKAANLGFSVAKPYGDSDRYDFIVDGGRELHKVQVKSANVLSQGVYFIASQRCSNGTAIPYTEEEIDFLAAYVMPEDAWFVIPAGAFVPKTSLHLFPRERGDRGMYARYREAWCLLSCVRDGGRIKALSRCEGSGSCRFDRTLSRE